MNEQQNDEEYRIKLKCQNCGHEGDFVGYIGLEGLTLCFVDNEGTFKDAHLADLVEVIKNLGQGTEGPWNCPLCGADVQEELIAPES